MPLERQNLIDRIAISDSNRIFEDTQMSMDRGQSEPGYYSSNRYTPSTNLASRDSSGGGYDKVLYDQDRRPHRSHHSKPSTYDDNSDTPSSSQDEQPRNRSSKKGGKKSGSSRSKSTSNPSDMEMIKQRFSTTNRGVGASMIGAVAGAVAAEEIAQRNKKGTIGATVAGLFIGGLAGSALEKGYDM